MGPRVALAGGKSGSFQGDGSSRLGRAGHQRRRYAHGEHLSPLIYDPASFVVHVRVYAFVVCNGF